MNSASSPSSPEALRAQKQERDRKISEVVEANCLAFAEHIFVSHGPVELKSPKVIKPAAEQSGQFISGLWAPGDACCVAPLPNLTGYPLTVGRQKVKVDAVGPKGMLVKVNRLLKTLASGKNGGYTDEDCATEYLLLEMDHGSKESQRKFWDAAIFAGFPAVSMVDSGGKSLHVIIRLAAANHAVYQDSAKRVMRLLDPFRPDTHTQNPSRFTRIPGVPRRVTDKSTGQERESFQELLYLNPDAPVWSFESQIVREFVVFNSTAVPFPEEVKSRAEIRERNWAQHPEGEDSAASEDFKRRLSKLDIPHGVDLPHILEEMGWLHETVAMGKETRYFCECPWSCGHSGGGDDDGERDAYFYDRGTNSRFPYGFHCSHATCAEQGYSVLDVVEMVKSDSPEVWAEAVFPPPDYTSLLGKLDPEMPAHEPGMTLEPSLFDGPVDETGNALIFATHYHNRVRFIHGLDEWVLWTDAGWAPDRRGIIMKMAETVSKLRMAACADPEARGKLRKTGDLKARKSLLELAASEENLRTCLADYDADPDLLGLRNGVMDLLTGQFRAKRPQDLMLRKAEVDFAEGAQCPRWLRFMEETHPDDAEAPKFLQRWAGYCLSSSVVEHKMLILYGGGRNGKGTFINVLQEILGDYGLAAPQAFISDSGKGSDSSKPNSALIATKLRRMTSIQETDDSGFLNEGFVKMLTGGDMVSGRELHGRAEQFRPTSKFILSTNHKPRVKGSDLGIWSRLVLVPFNACFADQPDHALADTLMGEKSGILNWMLEGYRQWRAQGLTVPKSLQEATEAYRDDEDIFGEFIETRLALHEVSNTPASAWADQKSVYQSYVDWCCSNNSVKLSSNRFNKKLEDRGFVRQKSHGVRKWDRVTLVEDDI